ncbi:TonB-dependent receptor plug domain-containing protein [Flavobacterium crassostreae]|uniref:TonB-dependent receptor n=1 Tax=Flavobacterium crassostreae TaxID=1763534 RepID=A0A1B9E7G6_9FLAO|nr:TonB-dependent receptor [Flavobacterium crassostreae]OCB77873.1 TonB-dependent receptor [Flavobacterium crassostreae]
MNKKILRISAIALLFAMHGMAQEQKPNPLEEVVILDSKFALPKEKSGKVIVSITAADLKKKQGQSLASILSTVAGVEINGNQSRNGKDLGVYLRGGRGHQVLILIDGVPVTDASGINLSYDLRLLPVEQIESIEIMKGAASTLYGSGAATGVISITLKKATNQKIAANVHMDMGTQMVAKQKDYSVNDFNQGFGLHGKIQKINYFASLNSTETTGISEAKPRLNQTPFEEDRFSRVNSLVKVGFVPNQKLSFDFFANYDKMKNEFDSGSFADNPNNFGTSEQYRVGVTPKYRYNKGELVLQTSANLMDRSLFNFGSFSYYRSRSVNADAFNKYKINNQVVVITGAQFQFHEMSNKSDYSVIPTELAKFNMIDPYATGVYNSDFGFNLNAGTRLNVHSKYGTNLVFNVNPSYSLGSLPLKVLASYSTAFVAPSLYQLYSSYGDLDLSPEEDATVELGFEASFLDKKATLSSVAFLREETNAIGFDLMTYKYFNVAGINKARGVETMISYAWSDRATIHANYTFTELEKQSRILNPKHKANLELAFQASSRLNLAASYQFVSDRYLEYTTYPAPAYAPVLNTAILEDYQLVNMNLRYELIKNRMHVFAAANNILDKDFVESRGFSTRGRNIKAGLTILL